MKSSRYWAPVFLLTLALSGAALGQPASPDKPARQTPVASAATPMQRADELLRQMTLEEKAMQLSSIFPLALFDTKGVNHAQLDALLKNGIGHVSALALIGHKSPETLAKSVNAVQRYLVTETRLKIPAIFHNEAMSGVVAPHFTAFPTPIGLAATWDPESRRWHCA
jgi:beta-glucosidase